MEKKIRNRVNKQMEKSQKEYYLSEQMKALKKEMGEGEDLDDEVEILEKKIADSGMPKDAEEKVNTELNKFKLMPPMSAEASVVRGYIDWMTSIPWKKKVCWRTFANNEEHESCWCKFVTNTSKTNNC